MRKLLYIKNPLLILAGFIFKRIIPVRYSNWRVGLKVCPSRKSVNGNNSTKSTLPFISNVFSFFFSNVQLIQNLFPLTSTVLYIYPFPVSCKINFGSVEKNSSIFFWTSMDAVCVLLWYWYPSQSAQINNIIKIVRTISLPLCFYYTTFISKCYNVTNGWFIK